MSRERERVRHRKRRRVVDEDEEINTYLVGFLGGTRGQFLGLVGDVVSGI